MELIAVGLLGLFIAAILWLALRRRTERAIANEYSRFEERFDSEAISLFAPIKKTFREIEASPIRSGSLREESIRSAGRTVCQVAEALATRSDLQRALRRKSEIELARDRLLAKAGEAENSSDAERDGVRSALTAYELDLSQLASLESRVRQIDAGIAPVRAEMSGLLTRLTMDVQQVEDETLRESLSRLQALSKTFDEVREMDPLRLEG
jgi:hypothetical protein